MGEFGGGGECHHQSPLPPPYLLHFLLTFSVKESRLFPTHPYNPLELRQKETSAFKIDVIFIAIKRGKGRAAPTPQKNNSKAPPPRHFSLPLSFWLANRLEEGPYY